MSFHYHTITASVQFIFCEWFMKKPFKTPEYCGYLISEDKIPIMNFYQGVSIIPKCTGLVTGTVRTIWLLNQISGDHWELQWNGN